MPFRPVTNISTAVSIGIPRAYIELRIYHERNVLISTRSGPVIVKLTVSILVKFC